MPILQEVVSDWWNRQIKQNLPPGECRHLRGKSAFDWLNIRNRMNMNQQKSPLIRQYYKLVLWIPIGSAH